MAETRVWEMHMAAQYFNRRNFKRGAGKSSEGCRPSVESVLFESFSMYTDAAASATRLSELVRNVNCKKRRKK